MLRIEMLSSGDEVLHGQILDTNAAWLGRWLFEHGAPLSGRSTVGDNVDALVAAITSASRRADALIVNGGLGPTSDDLSAQAAALALGVALEENPDWLVRMQAWFEQRGQVMPPNNRKQACLPQGAELLDNPVGTACGFAITLHGCMIFFTPGVPDEFMRMVGQQIFPRLQQRFRLPAPPVCLRLSTLGRSESSLAEQLADVVPPAGCMLGYRSVSPIIEIKLTGPAEQAVLMQAFWQRVRTVVASNLLFEGETGIAARAAMALHAAGVRLALSEQFSAGLIYCWLRTADAPLTDGELVAHHGASGVEQVMGRARELASRHAGALALACGERVEDTLTLALATPLGHYAQTLRFSAGRHSQSRDACATVALDMLCRYLAGRSPFGDYEWPCRLARLEEV